MAKQKVTGFRLDSEDLARLDWLTDVMGMPTLTATVRLLIHQEATCRSYEMEEVRNALLARARQRRKASDGRRARREKEPPTTGR